MFCIFKAPDRVKDYISPNDISPISTIWKISALDDRARAHALRRKSDGSASPDWAYDCVRFGLRGFVNFFDREDKQVMYATHTMQIDQKPYQAVDDAILKMLPAPFMYELATEILKLSKGTA